MKRTQPDHPELPFAVPTLIYPTIKIPQGDGSVLIRPGKPVEVGEQIGTTEAGRILNLSPRRVQYLCQIGNFKTATKPGGTKRSNWRVARSEVMERKLQGVFE